MTDKKSKNWQEDYETLMRVADMPINERAQTTIPDTEQVFAPWDTMQVDIKLTNFTTPSR